MGDMDFMNPKKTNKPLWDYTNYEEDIYVGYRYFDTLESRCRIRLVTDFRIPLFSYENPRIKEDKDKYVVTVTVKNTGKYSGKSCSTVCFSSRPHACQ